MVIKFFTFMLTSGSTLIEFLLLLALMVMVSLLFAWQSFKLRDANFTTLLLLLLNLLVSLAVSFGGMALFAIKWPNYYSSDFSVFVYFSGITSMFAASIILMLVPILYNYIMRNSKRVMHLDPRERHDFVGTNPSWLLLRLAAYYFVIAMGLSGATIFTAIFYPKYGDAEIPTLSGKLWGSIIFLTPLISGFWLGLGHIWKLNLISYKWGISDRPARLR